METRLEDTDYSTLTHEELVNTVLHLKCILYWQAIRTKNDYVQAHEFINTDYSTFTDEELVNKVIKPMRYITSTLAELIGTPN